jgi:hypothetical protein
MKENLVEKQIQKKDEKIGTEDKRGWTKKKQFKKINRGK